MGEPSIPAKQPEWADGGGAVVVEPTTGYKQAGWTAVKPPLGFFNWWMNLVFQWTTYLTSKMALFTGYAADTVLTVSSNTITPTQGNHLVDTAGGAANLNNIAVTNLGSGRILILIGNNPGSNPVTVINAHGGSGQILTADGNSVILSASMVLTLKLQGTSWVEVSRSTAIPGFAIPTGTMAAYAAAAAPTGWLMCDGSAVSRATYAALFSAISTNWGTGDGSSTFNVPDMRGITPRGLATMANVTGSGSASSNNATFTAHPYTHSGTRVRLASGTLSGLSTATNYYVIVIDANTLAFATTRANALSATKISITGSNSAVITQYEDPDVSTRQANAPGGATGQNVGTYQDEQFLSHVHSLGAAQDGQGNFGSDNFLMVTGNTGASGGNETRPRNIAVSYIIKT